MKNKSKKEIPVCGLKAVKALFDTEPEQVKRLFFDADKERRQKLGNACRYLAREKKVYRQVSPEELVKVGETVHHGGVVAVIEVPPLQEPSAEDFSRWARRGQRILLLDRIGNPHNLGAIARTAAFFGWGALIIGAKDREALFPNAATYRVAEGGLQHVRMFRAGNLAGLCRRLRPGVHVVGTALRGAEPLPRSQKAVNDNRGVALVLGNEETGVSPSVLSACETIYRIPGSGWVESLNVSATAAVFMDRFSPQEPEARSGRKSK